MKTLIIDLSREDLNNLEYILGKIAELLDEGYYSGIEMPVNWYIKDKHQIAINKARHEESLIIEFHKKFCAGTGTEAERDKFIETNITNEI